MAWAWHVSADMANTFRPRGNCCHLADSWLFQASILRDSVPIRAGRHPSFVDLRPGPARLAHFMPISGRQDTASDIRIRSHQPNQRCHPPADMRRWRVCGDGD